MAQWLKIHFAIRGTPAQSLVQEDSTASRQRGHMSSYSGLTQWTGDQCLERLLCNSRSHRSEKPARPLLRKQSLLRCKLIQATQSKGTPSTARKRKRTRCYPIITPQGTLTQWGQWSCRRLPKGSGCTESAPAPQALDSICRPTALSLRERTRSLLSPPPPPAWTQHDSGFFLSPASHSKPHAHTHS